MPRSPQTIEKLKEARRAQQILSQSLRLFAINGLRCHSINDIAASMDAPHALYIIILPTRNYFHDLSGPFAPHSVLHPLFPADWDAETICPSPKQR
jgi:hypothetical protein